MPEADARYFRVSPKFWSTAERRGWDDDTRLLALYLLTCPHRTIEGLFRLPVKYMQADLEWSGERLTEPFARLLADGFIGYDQDTQVCLLIGALKYQSPANDNMVKAANKRLAELPETPLAGAFGLLAQRFSERLAGQLPERFTEPTGNPHALALALPLALTQALALPQTPPPTLTTADADDDDSDGESGTDAAVVERPQDRATRIPRTPEERDFIRRATEGGMTREQIDTYCDKRWGAA